MAALSVIGYVQSVLDSDPVLKATDVPEYWRRILEAAFTPDESGQLHYHTVILGMPKKAGRSVVCGGIAAWYADQIADPGSEAYVIDAGEKTCRPRAFKHAVRVLESMRRVHDCLGGSRIELGERPGLGAPSVGLAHLTLANLAGDPDSVQTGLRLMDDAWAAGPDALLCDGWDLLTPVTTVRNPLTVVAGYAGFAGWSNIWKRYYDLSLTLPPHPGFHDWVTESGCAVVRAGEGVFAVWDDRLRVPWGTNGRFRAYLDQMRTVMRPMAFERLHQNRWVSQEND